VYKSFRPAASRAREPKKEAPAAGPLREAMALEQGLTLVPISAQLELTLPVSAQRKLTVSPIQPKVNRGCVPKVLKLSSTRSVNDVSRRSSS